MKQWYALYTRPQWEKKVVSSLGEAGYENYCPMNKTLSVWSDRKKIVFKPLFPSYVFVRSTIQELGLIREVAGVVYVVGWKGRPAIVQDREIEMIQLFLRDHQSLRVSKQPLNVNDRVKITSGALVERQGCVVDVNCKRVKVMLPSLGYSMIAVIAHENVMLFAPKKGSSTETELHQPG